MGSGSFGLNYPEFSESCPGILSSPFGRGRVRDAAGIGWVQPPERRIVKGEK